MLKPNRKLSLNRETILPLTSTDLDGVAGGVKETGCIQMPSRLGTLPTGPTRPRPPLSNLSEISGISRQVSGQSNAF